MEEEGRAIDVALPYRLGRLTYWHRGPFIPGARVLVPLKGKKKLGLILGESKAPYPKLKETLGLLDEAPIVPEPLLSFLKWVAAYHLAPEGEVIKYALPPSLFTLPKRGKKEPFREKVSWKRAGDFAATLYFEEDLKARALYLRGEIEKVLSSGACLFLFPDRELLSFYEEALKDLSPVIYTGDLTPKKREEVWFRALKGEIRLVLGTRLALFLPLRGLRLLVLEEEEHHGYKQEEGFRANFRDLSLMRAREEGLRVILASPSPSVKTYFMAKKGRYHLKKGKNVLPPVTLVDLRGTRGFFSTKLLNALRRTLARRERALIFLNRLGYAPHLVCEDCGHLWMCPRCRLPLRLFKEEALLRCPLCAYREKAPPLCPDCGGEKARPLGAGTERLKEILEKLFPQAAVALWGEEGFEEKDLIITTARVGRRPGLEKLSLVAVVLADQLLTPPSYLAPERAYQLLKKLGLISLFNEKLRLIVQTYRPEHHLFKGLLYGYEAFFREEILLRKAQGLPPFGRVAQLIIYPQRLAPEEVLSKVEGFLALRKISYFGPLFESPRGKTRLSFLLQAEESHRLTEALRAVKTFLEEEFRGRVRVVVDLSPE